MKSYLLIPVLFLGCGTPSQGTVERNAAADSAWKERVRASICRRPIYATSTWPVFSTAKHLATINIPPFLHQQRWQTAAESAKAGGRRQIPPYATGWDNTDSKESSPEFAQFYAGVVDSVKLVYPGPPEPEESICIEQIDGAQATVAASNRGASIKKPVSVGARSRASADSSAGLGPYVVETTMRYPDGLSFLMYGSSSTKEQQDQMLAAMRTIRRAGSR